MLTFPSRETVFCSAPLLFLFAAGTVWAGDGQPSAHSLDALSHWGGHALHKNGGAVLPETKAFFSAPELLRFREVADQHAGKSGNIDALLRSVDVDLAWEGTFLAPHHEDSVLAGAVRRHLHASIRSIDVGRPLFHLRTHLRSGPEFRATIHDHPDVVVIVHPLTEVTLGTVFKKRRVGY